MLKQYNSTNFKEINLKSKFELADTISISIYYLLENNLFLNTHLQRRIKNKELFKKIDENIPIRLRQTYLSLLSGQKISKKDNLLLIEYIREILNIPKKENQDE